MLITVTGLLVFPKVHSIKRCIYSLLQTDRGRPDRGRKGDIMNEKRREEKNWALNKCC